MSTGSAISFMPGKIINDWRQDYNECRPHSTLNYQTPSEFAAGWRKGHSENEDSDVTN
ncbi:hypothetical protein ECV0102_11210 [Enterobacter cloacae]|nr:hypothetical protein ECV0102_11210 [Enterobacter cloacae]